MSHPTVILRRFLPKGLAIRSFASLEDGEANLDGYDSGDLKK